MNKIKYLLLVFLSFSVLNVTGCATHKIIKILPEKELASKEYTDILQDKDLSNEEKIQAIQMKMAGEMELKKRAVDMERDNKLSNIINKPVTPLMTPPTILRVLVLPYETSDGILNSWKYSYVKVEEGKWVLSDYLDGSFKSDKRVLTPLAPENND